MGVASAPQKGSGEEQIALLPEPIHEQVVGDEVPTPSLTLEELTAECEKYQADLKTAQENERLANERAEQANRALTTIASAAPRAPSPPPPAPVELGPMPDPTSEPEKFNAWMDQKLKAERAATLASVTGIRSEMDERSRRLELWNEFRSEHPEYAEMVEEVKVAFLLETGETGDLPADTGDLKRRVAARMKQMGEKLAGKPPIRTAGVRGGSSAAPPAKDPAPAPEKVTTIGDSIAAWQEKSGFF